MKFATVAATLALSSSLATLAMADERQVIVLNLRGNPSLSPWPEGTRAVIAELATSAEQVLVRPSSSSTFAALMSELEIAAGEEQTVGAVCVGKSGSVGIAYVWVAGGASAIRVEYDLREGAVAEGAVALRVSQILHVTNLELPSARKEAPPPPPKPPCHLPPPASPPRFPTTKKTAPSSFARSAASMSARLRATTPPSPSWASSSWPSPASSSSLPA